MHWSQWYNNTVLDKLAISSHLQWCFFFLTPIPAIPNFINDIISLSSIVFVKACLISFLDGIFLQSAYLGEIVFTKARLYF